jgi:hypothetical protein
MNITKNGSRIPSRGVIDVIRIQYAMVFLPLNENLASEYPAGAAIDKLSKVAARETTRLFINDLRNKGSLSPIT